MNGGKFARLTAELLVRKGKPRPPHAGASVVNFPPRQQRPDPQNAPAQPREENLEPITQAVAASALREKEPHEAEAPETHQAPRPRTAHGGKPPPPPSDTVKPRRLMVTLTASEFETLGHMGVKKGATRHQLLRSAVDEYMALLGEEFGGDCQCIYTGCSCDSPS